MNEKKEIWEMKEFYNALPQKQNLVNFLNDNNIEDFKLIEINNYEKEYYICIIYKRIA